MTRPSFTRVCFSAAVLTALLVTSAPAWAQNGTLTGRVVNADGKPQPAVPVTLDQMGVDKPAQKKTVTDNQGQWVVTGLPADSKWMVTVIWSKVSGRITDVVVKAKETVRAPQLVLTEGGIDKATKAGAAAANVTNEEAAAAAKKSAALQALIKEADDALRSGAPDDALAKLAKVAAEVEKCAACYARMGDVYVKKQDLPAAEKAYLQAIEFDPKLPDSYASLATLYNEQKKFDEANKMAAKANELMASSGTMDASTLYNQGVILWNQGKGADAQPFFEKAIAQKPDMANAHYLLGMSLVNQGKLSQAKVPFETYLKLAPTGENAAQVKEMLKIIK